MNRFTCCLSCIKCEDKKHCIAYSSTFILLHREAKHVEVLYMLVIWGRGCGYCIYKGSVMKWAPTKGRALVRTKENNLHNLVPYSSINSLKNGSQILNSFIHYFYNLTQAMFSESTGKSYWDKVLLCPVLFLKIKNRIREISHMIQKQSHFTEHLLPASVSSSAW